MARLTKLTKDQVTDEVREGRTLEYKQQVPGTKDADKQEFLARSEKAASGPD